MSRPRKIRVRATPGGVPAVPAAPTSAPSNSFRVSELQAKRRDRNEAYMEFLRFPAMSAGIYSLPAGGTDPQQPHTEDEIYYVVEGEAKLRVAATDHSAVPGALLFVKARVEHRFHAIVKDLTVLVFFAPAEGTARN